MSTPARKLRHRFPVSLRQHWKLLAVGLVFVLVLAVGFGGAVVRPTITSDLSTKEQLTEDIAGTSDFFDSGEHSIAISFNETEYQEMIRDFQDSGEKDVIKATVTIDGTEIPEVGIRLKGNSTLMSLRGDGGEAGPGGRSPGARNRTDNETGVDADTGTAAEDRVVTDAVPDAATGDGQGAGMGGGMGAGQTQLSFDDPQSLPWLVIFDEYQEGRAYEGHTELSLRPATNGSSTAVNEALALSMTAESGQPTQDYSVASVSVNGGTSASRIVVDIPDGQWANQLGNGVLYKASADGSMDYVSDDPTDYENSYKQINAVGSYDLQPVMNLLDFVNNSSDETFAAELGDRLDVDAFAEYLATQTLLSNSDAMDGPGNNYYLWFDTDSGKFSVLSWDLNMALSGMGGGGMGGGAGAQTAGGPSGATDGQATGDSTGGSSPEPQMPADGQGSGGMPEGMPEGMTPPGDPGSGSTSGAGPDGGGGGRGSSVLKERFLADADFAALYEDAYARLYEQLITSGYAQDALGLIVERATAAGDTGAASAGETISEKLAQTGATSTADDASKSSMGAGRR